MGGLLNAVSVRSALAFVDCARGMKMKRGSFFRRQTEGKTKPIEVIQEIAWFLFFGSVVFCGGIL